MLAHYQEERIKQKTLVKRISWDKKFVTEGTKVENRTDTNRTIKAPGKTTKIYYNA